MLTILALAAAAHAGIPYDPPSVPIDNAVAKVALSAGKEVPHPKGVPSGATGKFTATLKGTTLTWTLTFSHLSGNATAAHVHQAATGKSGPVIIALCGPCKSPVSGSSLVGSAVVTAIKQGQTYVNVHTKKNADGEIRGQLKPTK